MPVKKLPLIIFFSERVLENRIVELLKAGFIWNRHETQSHGISPDVYADCRQRGYRTYLLKAISWMEEVYVNYVKGYKNDVSTNGKGLT